MFESKDIFGDFLLHTNSPDLPRTLLELIKLHEVTAPEAFIIENKIVYFKKN